MIISDGSNETTYDAVEDVLDSSFAEELVPLSERDLDDSSKLGELLRGIGLEMTKVGQIDALRPRECAAAHLDIGDTLKVGDQVLDESFPRLKSLNQNIGRSKLVRAWSKSRAASALVPERRRASNRVRQISLASSAVLEPFRLIPQRRRSRLCEVMHGASPRRIPEAAEGETAHQCSS